MDKVTKLKIFKARIEGQSIHQLSLDFDLPGREIEKVVASVVQAIRDDCRLTIQQRKQIELERIDRWTEISEKCLRTECEDMTDPETGKVYRDGVKAKAIMLKHLLDLSKHRTAILKLMDIEDEVKSESALLFEKIQDIDLDNLEDVDQLLKYNKQLQTL